jgi:hypothetical protein
MYTINNDDKFIVAHQHARTHHDCKLDNDGACSLFDSLTEGILEARELLTAQDTKEFLEQE